jgi:hypothetical protein
MNKATLKPIGLNEECSALQWAHQRLTLMLANSTLPPAFIQLDTRTRLGVRANLSIEAAGSIKAN